MGTSKRSRPAPEQPRPVVRDQSFEGIVWNDEDFTGQQFHNVTFQGCQFHFCDFSQARFVNCRFQQCVLQRCFFLQCELIYTDIRLCTGESNNFSLSHLTAVHLHSCTLPFSVFHQVQWERCSVQECNLQNASFWNATFEKTTLKTTDLSLSTLRETSLQKIDLSTCALHFLRLSPDLQELRGARVDESQAPELLRLAGIRVTIRPKRKTTAEKPEEKKEEKKE